MRTTATATIVALLCTAAAGVAFAEEKAPSTDWPHWRGPRYDGTSAETEWKKVWPRGGPKVLWRANVKTGFSGLAVVGDRVYTVGNSDDQDHIYCFSVLTGRLVWKYSYVAPRDPKYYEGGPSCTPTVDGKHLYVFGKRGQLLCLKAEDATLVWRKNVQKEHGAAMPTWGFASSPLVQGDRLFLNAGTSGMAFDKKTGRLLWQNGKDKAGYATPVPFTLEGQPRLAIFGGKALYVVDPADGRVLGEQKWKTRYDVNAADPIVIGTRAFIASGYGRGCALVELAGKKPKILWEGKQMRNHFNSCVLHEGHLYGFDDTTLKCLDAATGREVWRKRGLGKGSLMLAAGQLIVLGDSGKLLVAPASPKGFAPTGEAKALGGRCWTPPVLANGRIYCRGARGDLVCLDVRP
jgi:outer membrane protein assembly factor BamB